MWIRGLRAHKRCRWWFWLAAPSWSSRCTVTSTCVLLLWEEEMRAEHLFYSRTLSPYLQVPQLDKPQMFWGLETDIRTRPSIFTSAPNVWRHQVIFSQDLQVCCKLTLPDISDEEGRTEKIHTSCLDYTHTRTYMHTLEIDTANIHTGDII